LETLSASEAEGVIAHEVLHCASKHHTRRKGRDAKRWNIATDLAINRDLIAAGFKLPAGALIDPKYGDLGAEAIYRLLEQEEQAGGGQSQPAPGQSGGTDPGGCGEILDAAPEHDTAAVSAAEAEWDTITRQAVNVAKARNAGQVPGNLARLVETMNAPRVDWRGVLRRFVDESTSRDFSWMRPNRRHLYAGRIMPGYVPDRPSHVVAMIDTSGSIQPADLAAFRTEIQAALDDGAADRVTVAYADTVVHAHDEFAAGDLVRMEAKGGGGTSFAQPLAWVAENVPDVSAVLYMTDCQVTEWGDPPAPVLWVVTGDPRTAARCAARAPFGEVIILAD
jgi:predicted metal-dependent peptidase